jgi:GNAT superfamily N-acetyltransferase
LNESPVISPLRDVDAIADLAADAERDGHRMVSRLIADWQSGADRFERPGERAYAAVVEGKVVGVCGLNIDPYAGDPLVGRVRRLYVAVSHRRASIGSVLVDRIVSDAIGTFARLRLRTHNPAASAFYRARGFIDVSGDEYCTHEKDLR